MNSENPKKDDTSKQSADNDQEESAYENTVPTLTLKDDAVIIVDEDSGTSHTDEKKQ